MTAVNFMEGRISGKLARCPIEWVGEIKIGLRDAPDAEIVFKWSSLCSHVAIVVTTENRADPASSLT